MGCGRSVVQTECDGAEVPSGPDSELRELHPFHAMHMEDFLDHMPRPTV